MRLRYVRADSEESERETEPLCVLFWSGSWTFTGWCRLRGDFRQFRLDRMRDCASTGDVCVSGPARGFDALERALDARARVEACEAVV